MKGEVISIKKNEGTVIDYTVLDSIQNIRDLYIRHLDTSHNTFEHIIHSYHCTCFLEK